MPTKPVRLPNHQTNLSESFAAPNLWKHSLPTIKQHHEFVRAVRSNPWNAHLTPSLIGLDTIPLYNDHFSTDRPVFIQRARFYSDKLVIYPSSLNPRPKLDQPKKCLNNLTRGSFKGFISKSAGTVIRKRLETWIKSVQVNKRLYRGSGKPKHSHIVFLTVTLPSQQIHGDNEIKRKILMPFIQELKRRNGVDQYFWSAEPQENGNVHFHLLIDRYVRADLVNDLWNSATDHLGYHDRFIAETGSTCAPSTRINECPPNMSLVKYVLKYVSKQPRINYEYSSLKDQAHHETEYFEFEEIKGGLAEVQARNLDFSLNDLDPAEPVWNGKITKRGLSWVRWYSRRPIEGRSWGMSKEISALDVFNVDVSYRVQDLVEVARWDSSIKMVQMDHCEVYYCNVFDLLQRVDFKLARQFEQYYLRVYADLYLPKKQAPPLEIKEVASFNMDHFKQPRFVQRSLLFA